MGRYKSRRPNIAGILPDRYLIEPPINLEKAHQLPKEQSESQASTTRKTDDIPKTGPKRAVVITGEQARPAQTIEEGNFQIVDIEGDPASASGNEPPQDNQPSDGTVVIAAEEVS